jgi:hypothetical protein
MNVDKVRIETLETALREARQWFADQIEVDLDFCCPKLPDGSPDEDEMDEESRPMIEETRALLARIDAALASTAPTATIVREGAIKKTTNDGPTSPRPSPPKSHGRQS